MLNSKYNPEQNSEYSNKALMLNFQGFTFNSVANGTVTFDYLIPDDCLLDGIQIDTVSGIVGDNLQLQVVDKDGVYGPAETVTDTPIESWKIVTNLIKQMQHTSTYPLKILGGTYIRCTYTSVNTDICSVVVNLNLHKILW